MVTNLILISIVWLGAFGWVRRTSFINSKYKDNVNCILSSFASMFFAYEGLIILRGDQFNWIGFLLICWYNGFFLSFYYTTKDGVKKKKKWELLDIVVIIFATYIYIFAVLNEIYYVYNYEPIIP